jgi:hypothetical protein
MPVLTAFVTGSGTSGSSKGKWRILDHLFDHFYSFQSLQISWNIRERGEVLPFCSYRIGLIFSGLSLLRYQEQRDRRLVGSSSSTILPACGSCRVSLHLPLLNTPSTDLPRSLATETENVRKRLATHVNDLMSLGVDGIRIDAAKRTSYLLISCGIADLCHLDVPASDLSNIMGRLSKPPSFVTQEVCTSE